ncbi:MAG: response regulator [Bacteroidota bacterium]
MKVIFCLIPVFFLHSVYPANAQKKDSLLAVIDQGPEDKTKLSNMFNLAVIYYNEGALDSLRIYQQKGLELSIALEDAKYRGHFLLLESWYLDKHADKTIIRKKREEAKLAYVEAQDTTQILNTIVQLIGDYAHEINYSKGIELYNEGMDYAQNSRFKEKIADLNNCLAGIYVSMGGKENLRAALTYLKKNVSVYESLGNDQRVAMTYQKLAICQGDIGINPDSAEFYLKESVRYYERVDSPGGLASTFSEFARFYNNQGRYDEAKDYANKALAIAVPRKLPILLSFLYVDLSKAQRKLGNFKESIAAANEGLVYSRQFDSFDTQRDLYENLAHSSYALGDFQQAFDYHVLHKATSDSVMNANERSKVLRYQEELKSVENNARISVQAARIKRQQTYLVVALFGGILLAVILFLLYKTVSQQKKVNRQLERLNASKTRFFTNISHELRTPLTLVLSPLEKVLPMIKSDEAGKELALVKKNARKLARIVDEVLDFNKLENDKLLVKEDEVALEPFLRRILFSYHSLAQTQSLMLSLQYHLDEKLILLIDHLKFEKVLDNLLSNAIKNSYPGGSVTLKASQQDELLKIDVIDQGKGIARTEQVKIFERYYQVENGQENVQGGTGIGLAYSSEIIALMNGDLTVKSELGRGSQFTILIPFKKAPSNTAVNEEINGSLGKVRGPVKLAFTEKPHVLLVEDNHEMVDYLSRSLSKQFQFSTAYDGEVALQYLSEGLKPDIIISDVMMPKVDGMQLLKEVRKSENLTKVPFILLTAKALEEDKITGLQMGVDDYITKPFNLKELEARIQNLLQNRRIRESPSTVPAESGEEEKPLSHPEKLIKKARKLILENIADNQYRVKEFADDMAYSTRQLERILKKETGLSPVEFIREIRLQKAYELIQNKSFATVREVSMNVGMDNSSYFSKKFQERFGVSPKAMMME